MRLRKVNSLSSDVNGYINIASFREAKKIATDNIKNGVKTSVYIDYFDGNEDIDPIKDVAYFTNDGCTKLIKSIY